MSNQSVIHVPYESNALKQTHPLHLFKLAIACHLQPKPPHSARVLELACASGGNIIPMAFFYPQSTFVGLDINPQEIALATAQCEALKVKNCLFFAKSIVDFEPSEKFDYIICHGLYSWVESSVRESILKICQQYLSENGIAYISYNTYPAWTIGDALRDLLLFSTNNLASPQEKLLQTHGLLNALHDALSTPQSPYEWLLQEEVQLVLDHSDSQLLHEHLGSEHYPCYFYEFVENAQKHDLHYLCDATFFEFEQATFDVAYSQQQDLLHNRRFRSSLLTKQSANLTDPDSMKKAYANLGSQVNTNPIVSDLPQASLLSRYQITQQEHVTNKYHENILLSPIAQAILPYLDGKHDANSLKSILKEYIEDGFLVLVDKNQQPITELIQQEKQLSVLLQETLHLLASRYLIDI